MRRVSRKGLLCDTPARQRPRDIFRERDCLRPSDILQLLLTLPNQKCLTVRHTDCKTIPAIAEIAILGDPHIIHGLALATSEVQDIVSAEGC